MENKNIELIKENYINGNLSIFKREFNLLNSEQRADIIKEFKSEFDEQDFVLFCSRLSLIVEESK
jgi:hypothetical protein